MFELSYYIYIAKIETQSLIFQLVKKGVQSCCSFPHLQYVLTSQLMYCCSFQYMNLKNPSHCLQQCFSLYLHILLSSLSHNHLSFALFCQVIYCISWGFGRSIGNSAPVRPLIKPFYTQFMSFIFGIKLKIPYRSSSKTKVLVQPLNFPITLGPDNLGNFFDSFSPEKAMPQCHHQFTEHVNSEHTTMQIHHQLIRDKRIKNMGNEVNELTMERILQTEEGSETRPWETMSFRRDLTSSHSIRKYF